MAGSPPEPSKVDAIYDLLADLPTVDNGGYPLSLGKFRQALVGALNEPAPSLGNASPLTLLGLGPFSFPPRPLPSAFTKELEDLRVSLNLRLDALQSTIEGIQRPPLPSAPMPATPTPAPVLQPCAQKPRAEPPTPAPAKATPTPARDVNE
ncbi:hypothetical protein EDB84DRAFT_1564423 [Lactarius hengduanensis]|nr:hypothetical protein EDB84DRAFT_1564423 [Lactarius hengduanensis]